jgi:1-acyl-sn-glycerol-3-phosphate acyltransferase
VTERPQTVSDGSVVSREAILTAVMTFLAAEDVSTLAEIRQSLEQALDAAGPGALDALGRRLGSTGGGWTYYPPDPLARTIHRTVAERVLRPGSTILGADRANALAGRPVVIIGNHLSYSDANLLEVLLFASGASDLADRLTAIAGPKVYSSLKRRFSSLCFGTVRTPQNSALSSEDAVMSPRDVAAAARQSIESAHVRLRRGDALLVYAEGTRSRTRGLQPLLAGVTRYLASDDVLVLPIGMVGSETLYPVGGETLNPVTVIARVGCPGRAGDLRQHAHDNRRLMMDAVGCAIADLLPAEYRGAYSADVEGLDEARDVAREVFGAGTPPSGQA